LSLSTTFLLDFGTVPTVVFGTVPTVVFLQVVCNSSRFNRYYG
jgi:hypothetical protein